MTALDALLLELVPTRPAPAEYGGYWTTAEQDAHWHALCDAVGTPDTPRPGDQQPTAA